VGLQHGRGSFRSRVRKAGWRWLSTRNADTRTTGRPCA
jgi:hypothetical protein